MDHDHQSSPFAENQLGFIRMLRRAGLPVVLSQMIDYLRALELIDIGRRDHVFHAARSVLVTRGVDLPLFDSLFERFWSLHRKQGALPKIRQPFRASKETGLFSSLVQKTSSDSDRDENSLEVDDRSGTYSRFELLRRRNFAEMSTEELATVRRLLVQMSWNITDRRSRRLVSDRNGKRLDLRAVVRQAARHGGAPLKLSYRSRKVKQRSMVVLADISGSMEKYSRLLLQFLYCMSRGLDDVDAFVFGTRLTRVTLQLRLRNIDRALEEAAGEVIDWAGGTRIGESLAIFNRRWSRRVLRRGAIVLIISDGWERGDSTQLQREMRFLQHRCHRLVWLNPLLAAERYQPLVEGMASALPFVDDFLPVHNMNSLQRLALHLASIPERRSQRRSARLSKMRTAV